MPLPRQSSNSARICCNTDSGIQAGPAEKLYTRPALGVIGSSVRARWEAAGVIVVMRIRGCQSGGDAVQHPRSTMVALEDLQPISIRRTYELALNQRRARPRRTSLPESVGALRQKPLQALRTALIARALAQALREWPQRVPRRMPKRSCPPR